MRGVQTSGLVLLLVSNNHISLVVKFFYALVAQMNRAIGFYPIGCGFESLRVYHLYGAVARQRRQPPCTRFYAG